MNDFADESRYNAFEIDPKRVNGNILMLITPKGTTKGAQEIIKTSPLLAVSCLLGCCLQVP